MCDPIRWRSYGLLRGLGPMRAKELSAKVAVSEASMLKHLALMEEVGFARPDKETGSAPRYQMWSAIEGGLRLTGLEASTNPDHMQQWMQAYLLSQNLLMRTWAKEEATWPIEWREASLNYEYWMKLTLDELQELTDEIQEVTERWKERSRSREKPEGAEAIFISTNAFPVRE